MRYCYPVRSLIVLCFLVVAVAGADDGRIEIGPTSSFPIIIDQPGSYVLTTDLNVTEPDVGAIEIRTTDLTLDLAGHLIQGNLSDTPSEPYSMGVGVPLGVIVRNLRIKNGIIRGFYYGVKLDRPTEEGGHILEDISTSHNSYGIDADDTTITNCSANHNRKDGMDVARSVIQGCIAMQNGLTGILAISGSVVRNCSSDKNGGDGIFLGVGSLVIGCSARSNDYVGINVWASQGCNIVNNVAYDNTGGNLSAGCCSGNGCHQNYAP